MSLILGTSYQQSTLGIMATSTEKWIACGKEMGLKDAALLEFVTQHEKEEAERDERAHLRSIEKEKREVEQMRLEEQERACQHEKQMKEMELREKEKDREHERSMQGQPGGQSPSPRPTTTTDDSIPKGPKLPYYDDSKDDIDSYIRRFERYAEACKWDKSRYATYLGNLLQGKALEVYVRMPTEDICDYTKLKNALLRRFEMTEEGFRTITPS